MARGLGSTLPIAAICGCALAGCGNGGGLVVRTVSEYGGTPIAGVKVQVGDQPWTTTGSNGEARFAPVAPPYTVRVYQALAFITLKGEARQRDKVWQLVGQTGNPLVLEVDGSLAQSYKAHVSGAVAGRSGAANTQVLVEGWKVAPDGTFGTSNGPVIWWEGSTSYDFVLRAVESDTEQPPAHYIGYAASRVRATDTTGFLGPGGNLSGVSLQLGPVAEARVSGQVTRAEAFAQGTLLSSILLRFGPYEWMGLGQGAPSGQPAAFDYAVPRIDGAAPWLQFLAATGNSLDAAYGWHGREVGFSSTGLTFDIPAPVSLTDPVSGATFGPSTLFRWSAGPAGGKYSLELGCDDWNEGALTRNIHYRGVETTSTEVTLPAIPDVAVPTGATCRWSVAWIAPFNPALENRGSRSFERASIAR
ncbi:MAG TPA: carboxypeptidase-like regulatory domain-containing protein [Myxococcales bacterium]|nr:carboxypeptidase-like regulatory domain-containing protein [Myxococcales bacterium]